MRRAIESDAETRSAVEALRLDRWLWCARFYKSRTQAAAAVVNGRVQVGGQRAKPARPVRIGDELRIARPGREIELRVCAIPTRRGPALEARTVYAETPESIARNERARAAGPRFAAVPRPTRRPDKKARRELLALARRPWPSPDSTEDEEPGGVP